MKPIIIAEEAALELAGSVDFYERERDGLGLNFERETRAAVALIQSAPERHPQKQDGTRRYVMSRFPFVIHYMVLPACIWIVAFAHTSRKPNYWRRRFRLS